MTRRLTGRLAATRAALGLAGAALAQTAPEEVESDEYGAVAESLTGTPGDPASGMEVMIDRGLGNCVACHQVTDLEDDADFHGDVGPSLDGVAQRWDEAQLRGIVANAKHAFPGTIMISFYDTGPYIRPGEGFTGKAAEGPLEPLLTAQQVEDVTAYLMTLDTYPE